MPNRPNVSASVRGSGSGCRPFVPVLGPERSRSRWAYSAPGICAEEYSRSPHAVSSSLKRQSMTAKSGSPRCKASAEVEISVLKAIGVRYHLRIAFPPTNVLNSASNTRVKMLWSLVLAAAVSALPSGASAAAPDVQTALRITGEVGGDVWERANAIDAFVQRDPEEGGRPSQRTEFRVAYDAT